MGLLSSHSKHIIKCGLAFVAGSQLIHQILRPLSGIDDLTAEKKSALWKEYLESKERAQT